MNLECSFSYSGQRYDLYSLTNACASVVVRDLHVNYISPRSIPSYRYPFRYNLEQNVPATQITMPSALHGSLICYCGSCGIRFCHGCRRPQNQCEKPGTCRPRITTAISQIISLVDVSLLRLVGPKRVNNCSLRV